MSTVKVRNHWWSTWPLSPLTAALPALVLAALSYIGTRSLTSERYGVWVQTSAQFHEALTFCGPVAAAAGCFYSARLAARGSVLSLPSSPRIGWRTAARHIGVLSAYCVLGYIAGLIPLLVFTVDTATSGTFAVWPALTGIAALVLCVSAGYAMGVVAKSTLVVPISALVVFLFLQLPNFFSTAWAASIPLQAISPGPGQYENPPVLLYRLVFAAVAITAAIVVAAVAVSCPSRYGRALPMAIALLAPALLLVVPLRSEAALFALETDSPRSCTSTSQGVEVCTHQANSGDLHALADNVESLLTSYGPGAHSVRHVYDRPLGYSTPYAQEGVVWVGINPDQSNAVVGAQELAAALTGQFSCPSPFDEQGRPTPQYVFAGELAFWLTLDSGSDSWSVNALGQTATVEDGPSLTPAEGTSLSDNVGVGMIDARLANMSRGEIRQFIADNADRIATCAVTFDDLTAP